jgi:peptidyl-dipeptidase Dcp
MTENLKQKILQELEKDSYPDLAFLYSSESLALFPELLLELLGERKAIFQELILKPKEEITFEDFEDFSKLSYLWSLLHHLDGVNKSETSEKIIEDFEPFYMDFSNQVTFSLPYYERVCYVLEHEKLDSEQKRILELSKKSFELSGINLPNEIQEEIKKINLELSKLSTTFQNNIVASKKKFSYHIKTIDSIKELPEATLENARKMASEK